MIRKNGNFNALKQHKQLSLAVNNYEFRFIKR